MRSLFGVTAAIAIALGVLLLGALVLDNAHRPERYAPVASAPPPTSTAGICTEERTSEGTTTVCPGRGPVGTPVSVEGICVGSPEHPRRWYWVFGSEGGGTGTFGASAVAIDDLPTDEYGRFSFAYVIPATLGTLQGRGGGPVVAGEYFIYTKPMGCWVKFVVT